MPRLLRAALVAIVIAAVLTTMRRLHLTDHLSIERMRALVGDAGPFGPLVFIGIFISGFFLPGPEMISVAFGGVLFGTVWGFVYSWIACVIGTALPFILVRYGAQEWAQRALHDRFPRFRALDDRLEHHGVLTVALLRLVFFLAPLLNWSLGATRLLLRDYVLGTAIGILPGIGLTVFLADRIAEAGFSRELLTLDVIGPAAALAVLIGIGVAVGHRMMRRSAAARQVSGGETNGRPTREPSPVERREKRRGRMAAPEPQHPRQRID
jgi:uncharacterized membrane protein YdjX (TVP38/TMEM64 family)